MFISGAGMYANLDLTREGIASVEGTSASTANGSYYQNENSEKTFVAYFNRAMKTQQEQELAAAKKLRDLRLSEDYKTLQVRQGSTKVVNVADTYP